LSEYQRNPFNDAEPVQVFAPSDIVPRSAPDPDAVARLEAMHGKPVTISYQEIDQYGVRTIETEALLMSTDKPLD
jgi:hypothetical protein